eukprot:CAMPEP_0174738394 /NCGR_PEP_ID=MMETSP1094-20130205/69867_1 /TAXON_ID=156173 /ORGANISM="Chrysochromulina brevifilum, Strain UTEX LB 985" /LENGTH=123 /DNA_ID=CAMNT_0015941795 /DNA_START=373 /DNA_END=744 /DNA_ORIENTATION=+
MSRNGSMHPRLAPYAGTSASARLGAAPLAEVVVGLLSLPWAAAGVHAGSPPVADSAAMAAALHVTADATAAGAAELQDVALLTLASPLELPSPAPGFHVILEGWPPPCSIVTSAGMALEARTS